MNRARKWILALKIISLQDRRVACLPCMAAVISALALGGVSAWRTCEDLCVLSAAALEK